MVKGINVFKNFFKTYKNEYVLIGGAACDIIMEEVDRTFRATRDLDLVLIIESLTPEFGKAFWDFIAEGKYRNKSRSSGEPQFYRFDRPETIGYPYMLELFSKLPSNLVDFDEQQLFTPLHIHDTISSLSAILLNDAYYHMLLDGRMEINDVVLLRPEYMIPFKVKAWLDLSEKSKSNIHVDEKDIKKHKNDIVRLTTILEGGTALTLPEEVRKDMKQFIDRYIKNPVDLKSLKIKDITNTEIVERLQEMYGFF